MAELETFPEEPGSKAKPSTEEFKVFSLHRSWMSGKVDSQGKAERERKCWQVCIQSSGSGSGLCAWHLAWCMQHCREAVVYGGSEVSLDKVTLVGFV